ncbi:MAG: hypothetical protein IT320_24685 [Anaerolineae bacterium]|nr:hypothetical protein [Anaerolineae bacterium]
MRVVFFTDKTVAQCMTALHERLQSRSSRSLEGWVEKNGNFELSIASPVIGKVTRRTYLRGKVEREGGLTQVKVDVSSGADRRGQIIIFIACALVAVALMANGAITVALLAVAAGGALYIPLAGDNKNSPLLINEVQRTLKATTKRPKKASDTRTTSRRTSSAASKETSS